MEFWGFESHQLKSPGAGFGLFQSAGPNNPLAGLGASRTRQEKKYERQIEKTEKDILAEFKEDLELLRDINDPSSKADLPKTKVEIEKALDAAKKALDADQVLGKDPEKQKALKEMKERLEDDLFPSLESIQSARESAKVGDFEEVAGYLSEASGQSQGVGLQTASASGEAQSPRQTGLQKFNQTMGDVTTAVGSVLAPAMAFGGAANVIKGQAQSFFGQPGFTNASFGSQNGGFGFNASSGFGGSSFSINNFGGGLLGMMGFGGGDDIEAKSRKIKLMLDELLMQLMAGNLDAMDMIMPLVTLTGKSTLVKASLHMIEGMKQYDQQTDACTKRMADIAKNTQDAGAAAEMQKLTAQVGQYGMFRQTMATCVQHATTAIEEFTNNETGYRQKMERIKGAASRWS